MGYLFETCCYFFKQFQCFWSSAMVQVNNEYNHNIRQLCEFIGIMENLVFWLTYDTTISSGVSVQQKKINILFEGASHLVSSKYLIKEKLLLTQSFLFLNLYGLFILMLLCVNVSIAVPILSLGARLRFQQMLSVCAKCKPALWLQDL